MIIDNLEMDYRTEVSIKSDQNADHQDYEARQVFKPSLHQHTEEQNFSQNKTAEILYHIDQLVL